MAGKKLKLGNVEIGLVFGLGAFRRYNEITGHDIAHFEESILSVDKIGFLEANKRWAILIKGANDIFNRATKEFNELSIEEIEIMIDDAPQDDMNAIVSFYMDSNYIGNRLGDYYGIVKPEVPESGIKKKSKRSTAAAKP